MNTIQVSKALLIGTLTAGGWLGAQQDAPPAPAGPVIEISGNSIHITDGDVTPDAADGTDFGTAAVDGGTVVRSFTIANPGTGDLHLTGSPLVAVSGANAADFAVTALPSPSVPITTSTLFTVTFNPAGPGTRAATITVESDGTNTTAYDFAIQGAGLITGPEIQLEHAGAPIADGGTFGFGTVNLGASMLETFTIRNVGGSTLHLVGLPTVSGTNAGDVLAGIPGSNTLAPGDSTTFDVYFTARASGARAAVIRIASDDADGGDGVEDPYDLNLTATGTVAATPEMVVEHNNVGIPDGQKDDFGRVKKGGNLTHQYRIYNRGTGTLNLTGAITLGGLNVSDFSVTQPGSTAINAGTSATFEITFRPRALGTRVATAQIPNDGADNGDGTESPYDLSLTGWGREYTIPIIDTNDGDGACTLAASGQLVTLWPWLAALTAGLLCRRRRR